MHLHCTDTEGEWVVTLTDDGPRTTRAHEKSDVAVRGAASDLDLFVLGRVNRPCSKCSATPSCSRASRRDRF